MFLVLSAPGSSQVLVLKGSDTPGGYMRQIACCVSELEELFTKWSATHPHDKQTKLFYNATLVRDNPYCPRRSNKPHTTDKFMDMFLMELGGEEAVFDQEVYEAHQQVIEEFEQLQFITH
jgi:hypothetical protein